MGRHVIVKREHAQEQVDRRNSPPQPYLAVSFGLLQMHTAELHPRGQGREHVPGTLGADEDVHVDVPRASGSSVQ